MQYMTAAVYHYQSLQPHLHIKKKVIKINNKSSYIILTVALGCYSLKSLCIFFYKRTQCRYMELELNLMPRLDLSYSHNILIQEF